MDRNRSHVIGSVTYGSHLLPYYDFKSPLMHSLGESIALFYGHYPLTGGYSASARLDSGLGRNDGKEPHRQSYDRRTHRISTHPSECRRPVITVFQTNPPTLGLSFQSDSSSMTFPFLDCFLPLDGRFHGSMRFIPNEFVHAIFLGESCYDVIPVLPYSFDQIGCDTDIECPVATAGK